MIPQVKLLYLGIFPIVSLALALVWPATDSVATLICMIWVLLALGDGVAAWRQQAPRVFRTMPGACSLGAFTRVHLRVVNAQRQTVAIELFDDVPSTFEHQGLPARVVLKPQETLQVTYRAQPIRRGEAQFHHVAMRIASPLGLWWRQLNTACKTTVRVYPDFRAFTPYTLLAAGSPTALLGVHQQRRRGEGSDFLELRNFRDGDSVKHIDWKATARRQEVIVRSYQEEKDQQVVFLLDCGRNLHTRDGLLSHFDHALNAVLLLAYVALRQGDRVGLMAVGTQHTWVAPRSGLPHLQCLLDTVYGLYSQAVTVHLGTAIMQTIKQVQRRSLIVLASNLRDDLDRSTMAVLQTARRQHLVVTASLREQALDEILNEPVRDEQAAAEICAAHMYIIERQKRIQCLRQSGIACVDTPPSVLPQALVQHYLALKACGAL